MLKNQLNKKGNREGYWEVYNDHGILLYKGNYINSRFHGYWEFYSNRGEIYLKVFYLT